MEQRAGAPSTESFQLAGPIPPLFMPDFSLLDWYDWRKGVAFSAKYLRGRDGPMFQRDLASIWARNLRSRCSSSRAMRTT